MIMKNSLITILLMIITAGFLYSQNLPVLSDSLQKMTVIDDSLSYQADSISYYMNLQHLKLIGKSQIAYGSSTINSDSVFVNFDKEQANAMGRVIMRDDDQLIIGQQVFYDLETKTGYVNDGASQFELGFYYGKQLRKVGNTVYDVDYGRFTTCDDKEPHFDIRADRMRIYRNNMVVGRPVYFYVNHFPVMALPFASFSIKKGRHSGILIPEPGYNPSDGKYLRNIAFFYILNDYADITTSFDFMEKTGWRTEIDLPYTKRYDFSGNLNMVLRKIISSPGSYSHEWNFRESHNQTFADKSSFSANLDFASSRQVWSNETDIDKRLQESITSTMSYRKPFKSSTLYISGSYTDDLINKVKSISLPTASYSLPAKPVYELFTTPSDSLKKQDYWWKNFVYSWSASASHYGLIKEKHPAWRDILYLSTRDTVGYLNEHHSGIRQSVGLSWNRSIMNWLKYNNNVSFTEVVIDRDKNNKKLAHGYSYSTNQNLSFSLYGIKKYTQGRVKAVRHILTPTVGYSWSPDFRKQNSDLYSFSGVGVSASKTLSNANFSLNQKWQLKLTGDKENEEKKLNDFVTFSSSSGYNFSNEKKPWGVINHELTFNVGTYSGIVKVSPTQNFNIVQDPYDFDINSWRLNLGVDISGNASYNDYFPREKNDFITRKLFESDSSSVQSTLIESIDQLSTLDKPGNWSLRFYYDYAKDKINHDFTSGLRTNTTVKMTTNWSLTYSNYIDMKDHELRSQTINVVRDLHCWKLTFAYTKSNDFWDYRIVLFNLKLPDSLKFQTADHR